MSCYYLWCILEIFIIMVTFEHVKANYKEIYEET